MKRTTFLIFFTGLGIIWGGSFLVISHIVEVLPPFFSASARILVATIFLALIAKFRNQKLMLPWRILPWIWMLGILMVGLPFALLFWGEKSIPPGLAGVLNGTVPIWTAAFYLVMSSMKAKPLSRYLLGGLVLGFLGIIAIFWPQLQFPLHDQELIGGLAVLCMAISYSVGNVSGHKILNRYNQISLETVTFHQHLASFIFLFLLSLASEGALSWQDLTKDHTALAGIIYLGIVPSALGFTIYFRLLKAVGAVTAGAIAYLIPVAALFFDFVFRGQIPQWNGFLGMIFIMVGLKLIRSDPHR
jgi:drug/metabolite transporter (DMT)-like permease